MKSQRRRRRLVLATLSVGVVAFACGDARVTPDAGIEPAPTQCRSANGHEVCDFPLCPDRGSGVCGCFRTTRDGGGGYCQKQGPNVPLVFCASAKDGEACLVDDTDVRIVRALDWELATLFAQNGATERLRYADFGRWTGEPLPEPTSCPDLGGLKACAGVCGSCPVDMFCHGRSPRHPTGFCVPNDYVWCGPSSMSCGAGASCFTFGIEPAGGDAGTLGDEGGICFPTDQCRALAERLPGGGLCAGMKTDGG